MKLSVRMKGYNEKLMILISRLASLTSCPDPGWAQGENTLGLTPKHFAFSRRTWLAFCIGRVDWFHTRRVGLLPSAPHLRPTRLYNFFFPLNPAYRNRLRIFIYCPEESASSFMTVLPSFLNPTPFAINNRGRGDGWPQLQHGLCPHRRGGPRGPWLRVSGPPAPPRRPLLPRRGMPREPVFIDTDAVDCGQEQPLLALKY